jgi:hypothetical protein
VNAKPIVRIATARYLSLQLINARATTKIAGQRLPRILNSFLVCVRVRIFFRMSRSAMAPDMLITSQKLM